MCIIAKKQHVCKNWPQILATIAATFNMLSCGLLFSWPSIAIISILSNEFPIDVTLEQTSYFSILFSFGEILCCPLASYLIDKVGRKPLMLLVNIPCLMSWILIAFSNSIYMLYIARLIGGVVDVITFTAVPAYVAEICEPNVRGTWGNALTFQTYLGLLLINVMAYYLNTTTVALTCAIIPVVGLLTISFLPESPYYLLLKSNEEKAKQSLQQLRRTNIDEEFTQICSDVKRQIAEKGTLQDLFVIDSNRFALFVESGLYIAQQFSGISIFIIYAGYIFSLAGSTLSEATSTIILMGVILLSNCFFAFFLDRLGRRLACIISCIGSGVALTIECIYFYCSNYVEVDLSSFTWIPLASLLLYVVFYSVGLGIVPVLMLSEIFSTSVKGKAVCFINIIFGLSVMVNTKIFQTLDGNFGLFAPFAFFAICCFLSAIFSYLYVPETKGKTLEEIQKMLKQIVDK